MNGNQTSVVINGTTYTRTFDDEDRLVSVAVPGGPTDTFTYNGLGLRVGKTDSTGTYSYVCDGTSPGSPILSDGQAVYTPGLSERRNGSSLFYNSDDLGNLWSAEDSTGQAEAGAFLFTGFGAPLYTGSGSANASPLKYGGANDCQTDTDTGLVLMGHRYYDTRTGRFISQDKIEQGTNWYAYCQNNPINGIDPLGLLAAPFSEPMAASLDQIIQDTIANGGLPGEYYNIWQGNKIVNTFVIPEQIDFDHIIPGYNVTDIFLAARNFANTPIPGGATKAGYKAALPTVAQKLMYVYKNFHTNSAGDPKRMLVGGGSNPLYKAYDNIGNYGFGAMLAGLGLSLKVGEMGAGLFQSWQSLTGPTGGWEQFMENTVNNGTVLSGPPFGDDPWSQAMMQQGFNDYSHR